MDKYLVSPSPHVHSSTSTRSIMRDVIIALMPAVLVSVVYYGLGELLVLGVSVASCVFLEYLITRFLLGKPSTIGDLSAVVTGILLAMNLPYTTPWWVVFIGAVVAIGVAKMTFGGLGQNVFNPALVGRVFLLVSFPTYMTHWEIPQGLFGADAITGATLLGQVAENGAASVSNIEIVPAFFLNIGGSAGEISALALILGFGYLLIRKVVKPWITLSIFLTVGIIGMVFHEFVNPELYTGGIFNILTGGLVLGACFMATDYVTSPMSTNGGIIYGIGIGFLVMMIRYFGAYPEGVSFAILIMNMTVPLLNKWFHQQKFGRN